MARGHDDLDPEQRELLARLAAGAHAAGNASVAANPSDPAFWMPLDGRVSVPVVYREGCYICEDPEFAQMGLPLCSPCPGCVRRMEVCGVCRGTGTAPDVTPCTDCLATGILGTLGHIPADDAACDECGHEHGPWDYDEEGLITGIPPEKAQFIKNLKNRRK